MMNRPTTFGANILKLLLVLGLALPQISQAAVSLATQPLSTTSTSNVLPNVMFMLDDSGSMDWDYMPDDSKSFSGKYGFNSNHCNGVYYNPSITYKAPVNSDGSSYIDSTFTNAYVDGFNTAAGTSNLDTDFTGGSGTGSSGYTSYVGHAFYYTYSGTQTANWQEDFHNTSSIFYNECNSAIGSTTKVDGTNPVNTLFTRVTLASTETTFIWVNNPSGGTTVTSTSVNSIKVNGVELMTAASTGSTSNTTVATNIAAKIGLSGFTATATGNVITITGPASAMGYAPVITVASGNMTFKTDQFPDTDPVKLQNFANWYTYYSTRMMMMKTGVGLAFAPIDDTYRVGFMTMNNNVPPDIVDIDQFTGGCAVGSNACQKDMWYNKLYASNPGNSTPLREALSHVGQLYAHKFGAITTYKFTITVSGSGATTVSSITVNGTELLAGPATSTATSKNGTVTNNTSTLASGINSQINLDNSAWGSSVSSSTVTVTSPDSSFLGATPIVTQSGSMNITVTAVAAVTTTAQLNGIAPKDPVQYSCQQNFVILSTDGYWNGSTDYDLNNKMVGNQDGTAPRPMYDGASFTMTTSKTYQSQTQVTKTVSQIQSMTVQQQKQVSQLQQQTSQLQQQTSQLQKQTSQLQQQTSTLGGTLSQVLMKCANTAASCGTAPATGVANANWSVVTSGSCIPATNMQCAVISGLGTAKTVVSYCNTAASITSGTVNVPPSSTTTAYLSDNNHSIALGLSNGNPDTGNSNHCYQLGGTGAGTAWLCRGGNNNGTPVVSSSSVTDSNGLTWYLVSSMTGNSGCTTDRTAFGSSYSTSKGACPNTTATGYTLNNADSNGNIYSACTYSAWTAWAGVSSCTAVPQSGTPNNTSVVSATACQTVVTSPWAGVSSCTASAPNASGYSTQCQTAVTTPWAGVSTCTASATPDASGYSTQCRTAVIQPWTNTKCDPATDATTTPDVSGNTTQCQMLCNGTVAASCTSYVGTPSCTNTTDPANGLTVYCPNPNPVVTNTYVATSCATTQTSCTAPYTATSCQTTSCTTATIQPPTLVASCTAGNSGSPNYIQTYCSTTQLSSTNTASSCTAGNSGPPDYIQTTCTGGAGGTSDTLADVAMYYYQTDLRTSTLGNCTGGVSAEFPSGNPDVCKNNVYISGNDNNVMQHMTTFTLGLGARGRMVYTSKNYANDTPQSCAAANSACDFYSVATGVKANTTAVPPVCSWLSSGSICNWPAPASNSIANIDDLWHAAVDGRGTYFSATDPASLSDGLTSALSSITARKGAAAAAATSTLNPVAGNNFAYVASYTTVKWTGNLEARSINTSTGVISSSPTWCVENISADTCASPSYVQSVTSGSSTQYYCVTPNMTVSTCNAPGVFDPPTKNCSVPISLSCNGTLPPMVGPTSDTRRIFTANDAGTALTPFDAAWADPVAFPAHAIKLVSKTWALSQWASLTAAQQTAASNPVNMVNFLRGQNGFEDRPSNLVGTVDNRVYRFREAVLGDALESQPAFIAGPTFSYSDPGYSAFATAQASRPGTVYMGTNDGMLHAFDATTGVERWAFVPNVVIPNMYRLADKKYSLKHTNFVNGSPFISDYYCTVNCPSGAPEWRTILVGGLNAGGREYYALDITDPNNPRLLWEFTYINHPNLGYTFGNPVVTKMADGTWVVLITSGYNNGAYNSDGTAYGLSGDAYGHLYVLNAQTGATIKNFNTYTGTVGTTFASDLPSGLAKIAAWNNDPASNQAGYIYGGDLNGYLWRFDLTAPSGSQPFLFATFKTPAGFAQPITTSPTLGSVLNKRIVFVGTGKYLENADKYIPYVQSEYAIKDDNATATLNNPRNFTKPAGSTASGLMVKQTITMAGSVRTGSKNPVDFNVDRGWYVDFPDTSERVNVDSKLVGGALLVPTIVPSNTSCTPGGYGWLNFFDYTDGWPITDGTGTGTAGTNTNVSVKYDAAIVGMNVLFIEGRPVVEVVTSDNPTPTVDTRVVIAPGTSVFTGKRMQWREF